MFGPSPDKWLPRNPDMTNLKSHPPVIMYCTKEVERQGHDPWITDGIQRTAWMLDAWTYALEHHRVREPSLLDAVRIAGKVERHKNRNGIRTIQVRVGVHLCPHPDDLERQLNLLWEAQDTLQPIEFYKAFELIHPFEDGNGRTGKILLNWLNGSLYDPVFPPNDLFGTWIENP